MGVNGFLISPSDSGELAEKIVLARSDLALRQRASEYNWSIVREKGNRHINLSRMQQEYERLLRL